MDTVLFFWSLHPVGRGRRLLFSLCLAMAFGSANNIVATSLDSYGIYSMSLLVICCVYGISAAILMGSCPWWFFLVLTLNLDIVIFTDRACCFHFILSSLSYAFFIWAVELSWCLPDSFFKTMIDVFGILETRSFIHFLKETQMLHLKLSFCWELLPSLYEFY